MLRIEDNGFDGLRISGTEDEIRDILILASGTFMISGNEFGQEVRARLESLRERLEAISADRRRFEASPLYAQHKADWEAMKKRHQEENDEFDQAHPDTRKGII